MAVHICPRRTPLKVLSPSMDGAWNDKLNLQPFSDVEPVISRMIGSWMTGVNRNVEGKQAPRIMRYSGGHPAYREHCDAVAAEGYRRLSLE